MKLGERDRRAFKAMLTACGPLIAAFRWQMPRNERWRSIVCALWIASIIGCSGLYVLGSRSAWAAKIVFYIWDTSIFGPFSSSDLPYVCQTADDNCDYSFITDPNYSANLDVGFYIQYLIGVIISVRLICFAVEKFDAAFEIQIFTRILDKFLPSKTPSPPKSNPAPPVDQSDNSPT